MSQQYIYEPRPIFSSHTPNLLPGSYYIDDGFQADPSMWMDPLEDAFVTNAGMIEGKNDDNITYLEDFSAETILMGSKKLDELEVLPQSYFWKWVNYDGQVQIPTQMSEDDFESPAYERFMEAAVGYDADNPYFLLVVDSFMDDGEDVDIWAEEADWNRMQTTELWWKLYDLWMENEGVDFLTTLAEENYDWALANAYELQQIGYEIPEPDDDDYYWSMRQAESFEGETLMGNWVDGRKRLEIPKGKFPKKNMTYGELLKFVQKMVIHGWEDYIINMYVKVKDNFDDPDYLEEWTVGNLGVDQGFELSVYPDEALIHEAESFEAPYTGAGSLMGISGDTDLSSFTPDELTKSSAIHGDFDTASLDYSGHQNLEVRAEDDLDPCVGWNMSDGDFLGKNLGTSYDYKECGAPSVAKWGGSDETIKGPWCKDCLSDLAELEAELDCDHGTTDMSGRCTDCGLTEADQLNEREGGGWEDCPTCGVAIKIGGIGNEFCVRNCNEQRVWTILIDDNDAYSETFVFNSKKSAINFREAAMDSEYLQQQDIGVYNIVEQQVIDEEYPSDSYIADCLSIDCLKCGDECGCDE